MDERGRAASPGFGPNMYTTWSQPCAAGSAGSQQRHFFSFNIAAGLCGAAQKARAVCIIADELPFPVHYGVHGTDHA